MNGMLNQSGLKPEILNKIDDYVDRIKKEFHGRMGVEPTKITIGGEEMPAYKAPAKIDRMNSGMSEAINKLTDQVAIRLMKPLKK